MDITRFLSRDLTTLRIPRTKLNKGEIDKVIGKVQKVIVSMCHKNYYMYNLCTLYDILFNHVGIAVPKVLLYKI